MTANLTHADILAIRDASRKIVRDLGFMRPTLAGTELSPSAVHAIIEIGNTTGLTAHRLAKILLLEKSSVSRMLSRLMEKGLVAEAGHGSDGRSKILALTTDGLAMRADIDRFATLRVGRALHALSAKDRQNAVTGLEAYADALEIARHGGSSEATVPDVEIVAGFRPGALGRIAAMHGRYYAQHWRFPPTFEAKVAAGLADFVPRLDRPMNRIWLAMQEGEIVGSAAIDGEDLGDGKAHLRWVIVDDDMRGTGTGRRLVSQAMQFCDQHGFAEVHLWTFKGLDAARALYESFGFVLEEEWIGHQWGKELPEQKFVRRRDNLRPLAIFSKQV
jgi:DNA-binding MarR family transcriptional regulator/GNAT superfamily N-acetyltransferase